ncbi:MAG TPA: DUF1592 domain-containing protein [Fimbriimonas sp.]|nr:DUF1592 domain-containing protein [Fimbriimonas sp.]
MQPFLRALFKKIQSPSPLGEGRGWFVPRGEGLSWSPKAFREARPIARLLGLLAGSSLFVFGFALQTKKPTALKKTYGAEQASAFLAKNCVSCHTGAAASGGVALDNLKTKADFLKHRDVAERAGRMIESGLMPPKSMPQPSTAEKKAVSAYVAAIAAECTIKDPGRVTMRRLNRLEYDNTIRDLTGLDLHLSEDFPSDEVGNGFDNMGDVLSISPLLMEKYLKAAEVVATRAVFVPQAAPQRFNATDLKTDAKTGAGVENDIIIFAPGALFFDYECRVPGEYTARVRAYGHQVGAEAVKMQFQIDGAGIKQVDVKATAVKAEDYEFTFNLSTGKHRIGVAFMNDIYDAGPPARDRNLLVKWIDLIRPPGAYEELPATHRRIVFEKPTKEKRNSLARRVLSAFAGKAYRRPASALEVDRLIQITEMAWKNGEPFERGIQLGVQATLSSPYFLFRVEEQSKATAAPQSIGAYELASRLSYFLWGSMPDERLFKLAASGDLKKPAVLEAEARRMLRDPKTRALTEGFATQWLNLRKLNTVNVDPATYKDFNEPLRKAMMTETKMFFDAVVSEDRKLTDFLDGKFTYLNADLAKLYGLQGVEGTEFRKVSLEDTPRAGLLTQASILTLTSNPTRTSPVKRGKWVLEQILNDPPPPPPPGVPDLAASEPNSPEPTTPRELLKRHLKNPTCASCHVRMDPIGFSLENFDGIGKWRSSADTRGELPDGTVFNGPTELRTLLLKKKGQFVKGLGEKMLTYALGRGVDSKDRCYVDEIAVKVEKSGYKFSSLIAAVVTSEPFRMRGAKR